MTTSDPTIGDAAPASAMPIKFACDNCGARLSVSSRKAGSQAQCPKCRHSLQVPPLPQAETRVATPHRSPDETSTTGPPPGETSTMPPSPPDLSLSEFQVYDSEIELVYAPSDDEVVMQTDFRAAADPDKIPVARSVLYAQGILLGLTALAGLLAGILIGRQMAVRAPEQDREPQPCWVSGVVALQDANGQTTPDAGAVVILVPQDLRTDQRTPMDGLRPQDPPPGDDHPGLRAIRMLGGDYVRTDVEGRFQAHTADRGEYFLMVISARAARDDRELSSPMLAQIGRFFELGPRMFEGQAVHWQPETIRRDRRVNVVFPREGAP